MRKIAFALLLITPLAGCQYLADTFGGTPTPEARTTIVEVFSDACHTYASALRLAAQALSANLLTEAQIAAVAKAKAAGDAVCLAPPPLNVASALIVVVDATAAIASASAGSK